LLSTGRVPYDFKKHVFFQEEKHDHSSGLFEEEIDHLITTAKDLKRRRLVDENKVFLNKTGVLIFEKPSLRTHISFERPSTSSADTHYYSVKYGTNGETGNRTRRGEEPRAPGPLHHRPDVPPRNDRRTRGGLFDTGDQRAFGQTSSLSSARVRLDRQ